MAATKVCPTAQQMRRCDSRRTTAALTRPWGATKVCPIAQYKLRFLIRARTKCSSPLLPDDSGLDVSLGRYESLPHGATDAAVRIPYFGCVLFRPLGPGTMLQEATQGPK